MKKKGLIILLLAVIFELPVNVSYALGTIVYDPAAVSKLVEELADMEQELNYLKQQLKSVETINPNDYDWSNVQNLINQLGETVNQNNALAYSAQDIGTQFQKDYPGYQPPTNYTEQYQTWVNTSIATLNGSLQSLGMNANDFTDETNRMEALKQQSQSSVGQTQAIQVANQIAAEQVSQVQLLRQTVTSQANAQAVYYAQQVQQEASGQAELKTIIDAGSTYVPDYGTSGQYIDVNQYAPKP